MREERTEVLVVGAGPVGMFTALLLARGGVRVKVIDQESRTATRTYACALHPRTLKMLEKLDLAREMLSAGQRVSAVAFYEGETRRAEAKLAPLSAEYPFVLVLPQSGLEGLFERRLEKDGSLRVNWNHRLSDLRQESQGVVAAVDEMAVSAKGYIVPEMEWSVQRTEQIRADYVVGADGPNSHVVESLGLSYQTVGESEFFAVYEFQSDWESRDELRVVLDKGTTSVLWPLPGNKFRWSFQLKDEHLRDFPAKDRQSILIGDPELDRANRQFMERLIRARAPWFKGAIQELGWSTDVEFEHRVAKRFGQGRCWLVGDAAHQTGPAAMQSMNVGLSEAEELAGSMIRIIRDRLSPDPLESYQQKAHEQWNRLLGISGTLRARPKTDPWTKEHSQQILPCLPASGDDLTHLLDQLQLDWA